MISVIQSSGAGINGLLAYIAHDKATPGDPRPETDERVGWVEAVNMRPDIDMTRAGLMMGRLVRDAPALKRAAGVSARGRKCTAPFKHVTLSWDPAEAPDRETQMTAAREALDVLGCADNLAVVAAHTDTDHPHVHIAICAIDPETGKTARNRGGKNDAKLLSAWAEKWERDHGDILVPRRVERRQAREAGRFPLPAMERPRGRDGAGRPVRRSTAVRQAWHQLLTEHSTAAVPASTRRDERIAASRVLRRMDALPRRGPRPNVVEAPAVEVPARPKQLPTKPLPALPRRGPRPNVVEAPAVEVPARPKQLPTKPLPALPRRGPRPNVVEAPAVEVPARPEQLPTKPPPPAGARTADEADDRILAAIDPAAEDLAPKLPPGLDRNDWDEVKKRLRESADGSRFTGPVELGGNLWDVDTRRVRTDEGIVGYVRRVAPRGDPIPNPQDREKAIVRAVEQIGEATDRLIDQALGRPPAEHPAAPQPAPPGPAETPPAAKPSSPPPPSPAAVRTPKPPGFFKTAWNWLRSSSGGTDAHPAPAPPPEAPTAAAERTSTSATPERTSTSAAPPAPAYKEEVITRGRGQRGGGTRPAQRWQPPRGPGR